MSGIDRCDSPETRHRPFCSSGDRRKGHFRSRRHDRTSSTQRRYPKTLAYRRSSCSWNTAAASPPCRRTHRIAVDGSGNREATGSAQDSPGNSAQGCRRAGARVAHDSGGGGRGCCTSSAKPRVCSPRTRATASPRPDLLNLVSMMNAGHFESYRSRSHSRRRSSSIGAPLTDREPDLDRSSACSSGNIPSSPTSSVGSCDGPRLSWRKGKRSMRVVIVVGGRAVTAVTAACGYG